MSVLGGLHVASGYASRWGTRAFRILQLLCVFNVMSLHVPLEISSSCYVLCSFCS